MITISIASGKGGTGKTTIANNLAVVSSDNGHSVTYMDCDVEEPNGALFLKPKIEEVHPVSVSIPKVDPEKCTGCGLCGEICQYSAIVVLKTNPLIFPELCHGCGGCWEVCPVGAITETFRDTAKLETGHADGIRFAQGILNVGEVMAPPVIRKVKAVRTDTDLLIIDAPPGTSCPVIESIRGADFVLLVTEPTPFGLNDLKLAVEMVRILMLPFGVIINRADVGDDRTRNYCQSEQIDILAEIPDDRRIAEAYSRGELVCKALPEYRHVFSELLERIEKKIASGKGAAERRAGR